MKLIVPYANVKSDPEVHYCVRLNLALLGYDPEWVHMSEPNSYALLWHQLWEEGEPFVIIEHDVILWRGAVESVWDCEQPFCGYDGSLQCVKVVPQGPCPVHERTVWYKLDGQVHAGLREQNIEFHDHVAHCSLPPVTNLNRYNVPTQVRGMVDGLNGCTTEYVFRPVRQRWVPDF